MPRRGVTLPEVMIALTLIGVMVGMALPRLAGAMDRAALRGAQAELLGALDAARGAAIRLGEPVLLAGSDAVIRVVGSGDTTAIVRRYLAAERPLVVGGLATPIQFGPAGTTIGAANRTLRLVSGRDTVSVVLSRLGRIR